jgi:ubiquinone/menaquinone biosynthesis C-methylase UbiE
MSDSSLVPNHHADHPGFSGATGWLAAQTMRFGRAEVADLANTLVGLTTGERLVDVGSGPGVAARRAAARGAVVTGVEPSEVMLRVARGDDAAGAVTWRQGAAEDLPLDDASFDVAWSLSAVHHWPDLEGGLAEVRRVLVPGGRFLAIERRTHAGATGLASHGWTEQQADAFAAACRGAGFEDAGVRTHTVKRGPVLAVLATVSGGRGR